MNQAVFERFLVSEDGSTEAELAGAFGILLAPDLLTKKTKSKQAPPSETATRHCNHEWLHGVPSCLRKTLSWAPSAPLMGNHVGIKRRPSLT